jgi:hypothetical protein
MTKASNLFALLGDQEIGLTKSLGFMLTHKKRLLRSLLNAIEVSRNIPSTRLEKTAVDVEVADRGRRTDVEIILDGFFYVILEGKVGGNLPTADQLSQYARKLIARKEERRLCVITEVDAEDWLIQQLFGQTDKFFGLSRSEVKIFTWQELHENFFSYLNLSEDLDRQFEDYLEDMIMPNEILVASADSKYDNEDMDFFMKRHFFFYRAEIMKKRHDYLAMYLGAGFGKDQGIQYVARILKYELCSLEQLGLPTNSKYYKENLAREAESKTKQKFYKLLLGPSIRLPWKIGKSRGKRVYNWTTTFEKLLKAKYADELL